MTYRRKNASFGEENRHWTPIQWNKCTHERSCVYTNSKMPTKPRKPLPDAFTYAQALSSGLSKNEIYRRRDAGEFELIGRGLFRLSAVELADLDLVELALRAPNATLCLSTALVRHGLSDAIPPVIDVALPRGVRTPATNVPVQWHRFDPATFEIGRELVSLPGDMRIGLYNAERSIIDAFRLRGREGNEQAYDALKRWLRRPGAQPASLLRLVRRFPRAAPPIRKALEILL